MKHKNIIFVIGIFALASIVLIAVKSNHIVSNPLTYHSLKNDDDTDEQEINNSQLYTAAVALSSSAPKVKYKISSSTPQFVIFSFDGSKSVDMLNETLAFEQKMQTENKPLHFTYFINAAYFLTKDNAQLYRAPESPAGVSAIGFSNSDRDISLRIKGFNAAFATGNEIGSHSAGHFDGATWTYDEWKQEFNSFSSLMSNVQKNNSSQQIDTPTFLSSIRGFRAPNLGVNENLYKVLADSHFAYDASGISATDSWPQKDSYGLWHIPLGIVALGQNKSPVLSMDYNLWTHQSGAKELATKGTALWKSYFDDVESAYLNLFNTHYTGNRGPIVIGDHFSKWNDGVYWEAMKAFAENVCGQPQVRCGTFKDLVDYLSTTGAPAVAGK